MDEENYSDDSPVPSARQGETTLDPTQEHEQDLKSKSNTKMSSQKMLSAVQSKLKSAVNDLVDTHGNTPND